MQRFSIFSLARNALSGHAAWQEQWRSPEPRPEYDVIIVGGGGHGLATAYYLAKQHRIRNVAVLEKGWLGGGNTGRNTTIIRSNYLWDESAALYEHSLKLWEGLTDELDYDLLFSQRGVLNLAHSQHDVREGVRRVHANRLNGVDAEWLTPEAVKELCPILNTSSDVRYPILGATLQRRGGIARHVDFDQIDRRGSTLTFTPSRQFARAGSNLWRKAWQRPRRSTTRSCGSSR